MPRVAPTAGSRRAAAPIQATTAAALQAQTSRPACRGRARTVSKVLLDELAAHDAQERGARAVGHRLGKQRLAGAGLAIQDDALWRGVRGGWGLRGALNRGPVTRGGTLTGALSLLQSCPPRIPPLTCVHTHTHTRARPRAPTLGGLMPMSSYSSGCVSGSSTASLISVICCSRPPTSAYDSVGALSTCWVGGVGGGRQGDGVPGRLQPTRRRRQSSQAITNARRIDTAGARARARAGPPS